MSLQILLIDDSEADHHLFKSIVEKDHPNCHIQSAFDGNEAIEILDKHDKAFDVIFLDVNMPGMNGYEFMEAYGENLHEQNIPVYILTSAKHKGESKLFSPYPSIVDLCSKTPDCAKVLQILSQFT